MWKVSFFLILYEGIVWTFSKLVLWHLDEWWSKGHFKDHGLMTARRARTFGMLEAGRRYSQHPNCSKGFWGASNDLNTDSNMLCSNKFVWRLKSIRTPLGDNPEPVSVCDFVPYPDRIRPATRTAVVTVGTHGHPAFEGATLRLSIKMHHSVSMRAMTFASDPS